MPLLGELLVQEKVISRSQLDEAIQNQVIFGGRLGTNLVELGYLDEQTLTKYLAKKHGVPTVEWTALNRVKPSVLKLFTKKMAKFYEAFPLKEDGRDLYVVMANPDNDEAIQQIGFSTGKKIRALVLPEIRVYDLLTRFYSIGRELRYINLAMMYEVKQEEAPKPAKQKFRPSISKETEKERERLSVGIDFGASEELLSEEEFAKMAADQYEAQNAEARSEPTVPAPEPERPAPAPEKPAPAPARPTAAAQPVAPKPAPAKKVPPRPGSPEQLRQTAQVLYALLMKHEVKRYIDRGTLQEFLKIFIKSQLQNQILPMSYLANWMIIEANAPVEWLEEVLDEFKSMGPSLNIAVVLPGEPVPARPPLAAEPEPMEEPEVIEEPELIEEPAPPAASVSGPGKPAELESMDESSGSSLESVESTEEDGVCEVLELGEEDMATEEELEEFASVEAPEEEEEEEEEYVELTLEQARKKLLEEVSDRKDISRIFLGFARSFFKRSVLFTVRNGKLYGWDGAGPGLSSKSVESIMLGLDEPSVFKLVNTTMSFFLGPLPPTPTNQHYLELLGNQKPNNVFIMPVVVNEKIVYMLYGDNGEGEFVPVNAAELQILAYQIPRALDTLIKRKKAEARAA